mmetsp:Transcript_42408/g.68712  ORF Transcript_42408/g.68712 Transcript_42408/m.68712 type:complete len:80 (+) Transcript_42408:552-791(+)
MVLLVMSQEPLYCRVKGPVFGEAGPLSESGAMMAHWAYHQAMLPSPRDSHGLLPQGANTFEVAEQSLAHSGDSNTADIL